MTIDTAFIAGGLRLGLWGVIAFWLWLGLGSLFRRLRLPLALAVAAALSWVGAGLCLRWLLPIVGELIAHRWDVGLLTLR